MKNLFTPNFGQVPFFMAGRDEIISELNHALENTPGDPSQTSILIGTRGIGKTSLLRAMSDIADQSGWLAVNVMCVPGMLEDIIQQATRKAASFLEKKSGVRFKSISVASVFGIDWDYVDADSPNWRSRITDILESLAEHDLGLLITVDEVDPSLDELIQLASVYQLLSGEERKVALFMAGLPHQTSSLLANKSVSFLRRSAQYHLEDISDEDVEMAFRSTVEASGKEVDDDALYKAISAIQGFPYMLQLVGYRSCRATGESCEIEDEAIELGKHMAEMDMRTRVLNATLDSLSDNDLAFLKVMMECGPVPSISQIAEKLGKGSAHAATYRRRLLEQGVIKRVGRNRLDFAIPYLEEYLPEYLSENFL